MSSIEQIENLDVKTTTTQRSGLAVTSLVFSLIVCCPITTIIGPLLGVIALIKLKGKPHISGKGFAWSGIIIGVIVTFVWILVSIFVAKIAIGFFEQTRTVSTEALQSGYDGDYDTFRSHLARSSSTVTDGEIKTFIDLLKERFGAFDSAFLNMQDEKQEIQQTVKEAPIPIRFIFETKDTTGFIVFEFVPGTEFDYVMQIVCILIKDAKNGDIVFPPDSICAPSKSNSKDIDSDDS